MDNQSFYRKTEAPHDAASKVFQTGAPNNSMACLCDSGCASHMGYPVSKQNKRHNPIELDAEDVCEAIVGIICLIDV